MELGKGILTITCVDGKLTHDTEVMGSMSPYCTFVFNGKKLKTKTHSRGGKSPVWGDKFQLEVESHTEEIFLRVWDQDMTTSDAVGFTKIKLSSLMINQGVDDWFTITFDNKPAGEIHLISHFEPEGGDAYANL
jgi:Ca2+-dependent lipid-binding protein